MTADQGDLDSAIMALDGAINSVSALLALSEALEQHEAVRQGIYGVLAAVGSARVLVARITEEPEPEGDECPHAQIEERPVGSTVVKFCKRCGTFVG